MKRLKSTLVFSIVLGLVLAYLLNHIIGTVELAFRKETPSIGTLSMVETFRNHPLPYTSNMATVGSLAGCAIAVCVFVTQDASDKRRAVRGREHGTAKIGSVRDLKPFGDWKNPANNVILAKDTNLRLVGNAKSEVYEKNKNLLVQGGPGSGKTYYYVLPNLLQANSSYVVTDPKGNLVWSLGTFFLEQGYKVRVFNTVDFTNSLHYNPLAYIRSQTDILRLVTTIITNTTGTENVTGDPFWDKAEKLFLTALIAYIWEIGSPSERNFDTLLKLIDLAEASEGDQSFESDLDKLFRRWESKHPNSFAVTSYGVFKKGAGETMKSILISVGVRLQPFRLDEVREIMSYDELELEDIGDEKTFLGLVMSDTDSTFGFLIAMVQYQMLNLLIRKADVDYGGKLPIPVQIFFDEFRNIGRLPNWPTAISTIRSRGISATMVVQSLAQLKAVYGDDMDTLIDCSDTLISFGAARSQSTTGALSEFIGQETIETSSRSESKGKNGSVSYSEQATARSAMFADEIARMQTGKCLVLINGQQAVIGDRYDTKNHPNYKKTVYGNNSKVYRAGDERQYEADRFFDGFDDEAIEVFEFSFS